MLIMTCSITNIQKTMMAAPSKSCSLDLLPINVLKDFLIEIMPFVADMCYASLQNSNLAVSQRHVIVMPWLKKAKADPENVKNYRPISSLIFISKVVQRLVCCQLVAFLDTNGLLSKLKSGYRKHHSMKTVVLNVIFDILLQLIVMK